ncbi:MAG: hypothetical protein EBU09_03880 [Betaproteobacteria bacterium]|nr:hypothetical protein [Betaproteobacteria bacterium]
MQTQTVDIQCTPQKGSHGDFRLEHANFKRALSLRVPQAQAFHAHDRTSGDDSPTHALHLQRPRQLFVDQGNQARPQLMKLRPDIPAQTQISECHQQAQGKG